jgi:acyl dehydratase
MTTIDVSELKARVGQEIGVSDWMDVAQRRINEFGEAIDDHQWIHVDPARAAAESPFKTTIAHGFLTLSLISVLLRNAVALRDVRMAINYGLNRVRFVSPVPAGTRIRGRFVLSAVEDTGGAVQATWSVTVEREGQQKPCCVAEWLVRYYPSSTS